MLICDFAYLRRLNKLKSNYVDATLESNNFGL